MGIVLRYLLGFFQVVVYRGIGCMFSTGFSFGVRGDCFVYLYMGVFR